MSHNVRRATESSKLVEVWSTWSVVNNKQTATIRGNKVHINHARSACENRTQQIAQLQLWQRDRARSGISMGWVTLIEGKFWVEGLRFAPISMDRSKDGGMVYYNFAAGSFHPKKLYSRLYSIEIEFY